jgi:hypothetical protein
MKIEKNVCKEVTDAEKAIVMKVENMEVINALICNTTFDHDYVFLGNRYRKASFFSFQCDLGSNGGGRFGFYFDDDVKAEPIINGQYQIFTLPLKYGDIALASILDVTESKSWEYLNGKYIRIVTSEGVIFGIGHIIKDKWFFVSNIVKMYNDENIPDLNWMFISQENKSLKINE